MSGRSDECASRGTIDLRTVDTQQASAALAKKLNPIIVCQDSCMAVPQAASLHWATQVPRGQPLLPLKWMAAPSRAQVPQTACWLVVPSRDLTAATSSGAVPKSEQETDELKEPRNVEKRSHRRNQNLCQVTAIRGSKEKPKLGSRQPQTTLWLVLDCDEG